MREAPSVLLGIDTMVHFPIEYEIEVNDDDATAAPMKIHSGGRPSIIVGPPAEFGGGDLWWSPEHLLVSAATSCFGATLFAAAKRANLRIGGFRCRSKGTLDRSNNPSSDGKIAFTSIHHDLELRVVAGDEARARKLVDDVKSRCFVANSLRCPVEVSLSISAS